MDSQAFIEMCTEDVSKKIIAHPDLGEYEAYCWEQIWPTNSKGFSSVGADVLTRSMSCAISFKEITFVYHDDFAYACKTDKHLKKVLADRNIPGLIETADNNITLMQYRMYPFKKLEHTSKAKVKTKQLSIAASKEANLEKAKGVISISIRVDKDKAKEAYEAEREVNDVFARSGMNFDQWLEHQKWLALRERMNKM